MDSLRSKTNGFARQLLCPGSTSLLRSWDTGALNHDWEPAYQQTEAAGLQKRILLVDQDPDLRKLTGAFLQAEGYRVFSCGDPQRAVRTFCNQDAIDLLLTDLHMPDASGMRLACEISSVYPALPIIISGSILTDEVWTSIQYFGWHFLSKPFHIPDVLELIRELLADSSKAMIGFSARDRSLL
jgi:DNA-binding NtrC family response regulator